MTKNSYLSLLMLLIGFSLNAQNLTDDPSMYQQTAPLNQLTKGLPITSAAVSGQIDSTISTLLCDSTTITLIGTGTIYSGWSTDSLGANVIASSDTFTSGLLTSDTTFYHISISDSTSASPTLAAQTGTFGGNVRGYYFVAPVDMVITGFWVPTDANTGVQHVEILRFATAPPPFPALTNNFTSLGTWRNYNALDTIPTNIQIFAGDTLGIYGNRNGVNSYAPNNDIVIDGVTTPIFRSGMQFPIATNAMQDVWSEAGSPASISRVEFFYAIGSDTVTTLHTISLGQSYAMAQTFNACGGDTITFNGLPYTASTVIVDNFTSQTGCDSIITTTISIPPALGTSITNTICFGDSLVVNGTTYNAANPTGTEVFPGIGPNGCDSIVTINLGITPLLTDSITNTICSGDSLVVNGTTYNAANPTGTEVFIGTGTNGCDSSVIINLSINPILTGSFVDTICVNDTIIVNGTTYSSANLTGTEVFTGIGPNGCDSTVAVNLTIQAIDVTTTTTGITITANQTGATYQWVDCNNGNAPIAGETNSSYTPTANGDYAVVVTMGNCSKMSGCINITGLAIEKLGSEATFLVYPNPTTGQFTIELEDVNTLTTISLFDVLGQRLLTQNIQYTKTQIDLRNYSNGTYFIAINNQKSVSLKKLILNK